MTKVEEHLIELLRLPLEERLRAAFTAACANGGAGDGPRPEDVLQSVRASLLSHMGGSAPFDDISLIVIRRNGGDAARRQ